MHFPTLLLLFAPFLSVASVAPEIEPALQDRDIDSPITDRSLTTDNLQSLRKRKCTYNGCECRKGHPGVYCYNCPYGRNGFILLAGGKGGDEDHVYQCASDGDCCDYGYADVCKNGKAGRCGT